MFFPPSTLALRASQPQFPVPPQFRFFLIPAGLYLWQLTLLTWLRLSLSSHPIFLFEEAGSSILDVLYFAHRLQVCQVTTNIASYLIFWTGLQLTPDAGLTYGRTIKTIVMAAIPPLTYLLLNRRLHRPPLFSALTAIATGLLPGVFYYSVFALDMAMDVPFGLLALYFAFGKDRFSPIAAGFTLTFAALAYGSGIAFGPPVLYLLWQHPRRGAAITSAALAGCSLTVAAALYWTNTQVLFLGGGSGGGYFFNGIWFLIFEVFRRASSYYFTLPGLTAVGPFPISFLVLGGIYYGIRNFRSSALWIILALSSGFLGSASGVPLGIRRSIPMLVAFAVLSAEFLEAGLGRLRWRPAHIAVPALVLVFLMGGAMIVERHWSAGEWIRADYDFPLTQPNFDASLEDYRLRLVPPPPPTPLFGMRMTYAILHLLTLPDPIVSFEQTVAAPDTVDEGMPLFPRDAIRFSLWREQLNRLTTPARPPTAAP